MMGGLGGTGDGEADLHWRLTCQVDIIIREDGIHTVKVDLKVLYKMSCRDSYCKVLILT